MFLESRRNLHRFGLVTDNDGDNRRRRCGDIQPLAPQAFAEEIYIAAKLLNPFGVGFDKFQVVQGGSRNCGGHRRGEYETAGFVSQKVNQFLLACHETAFGGDRFAESADSDIGMFATVVFCQTAARFAKHTRGMRFVNHQQNFVSLCNLQQFRQIRQVAIHAEYGVRHNHAAEIRTEFCGLLASICLRFRNDAFQIGHVVVLVNKALGTR